MGKGGGESDASENTQSILVARLAVLNKMLVKVH